MTRWPTLPATVAPVPGRMKGKTMTDEIEALVKRLRSQEAIPSRNEVADAVESIAAQLAAAEADLAKAVTFLGEALHDLAVDRRDTDHISERGREIVAFHAARTALPDAKEKK